ncbi:WD repeat-containing protein 36, partial [Caerostris extrusa]
MILHRESAVLAIAMDNFVINLVDIESRQIIREFGDNAGNITDMTFSADFKWLIAAQLIDWFTISPLCVSLTISPSGEYLATTHAGDFGIYLWANSTLYSNVSFHPLPETYDPLQLDLPLITLDGKEENEEGNNESDNEIHDDEMIEEFKSPEQIAEEIVTLSQVPKSHWLNLLDLDTIKRRNKPKQPVQVPKNAPFFLPVVSGLKPTFLIEEDENEKKRSEKFSRLDAMQHNSDFSRMLKKCHETQN